MKSAIKHFLKVLLKKELNTKVQVGISCDWYGSKDAGFYVSTDKLNNKSVIYSFGVGEDISFDLGLIDKFNCNVFAFDPTPKSIKFIKGIKDLPNSFFFFPYALYKYNGFVSFVLPDNPDHVSCKIQSNVEKNVDSKRIIDVPCKNFSTIISELKHNKIDVLKMDIEGAEYEILDDILNSQIQIDQILIEFHHRFKEIGINKTKVSINKLNQNGYRIAAISEKYEEYSFIKV
jgi:FkbM family methyltransferase